VEAIEHAGPGQYDEAYLDYLVQVIDKARHYNIRLFIDPHQDVWGRLSGGDGAPGWTYEAVGFNPRNFTATGAAIVHATFGGEPLPRMIWPSNYTKLAAATMFTLFFGGNDFAPLIKIEGEPAQDYLQRHFIDGLKQVARRVKESTQRRRLRFVQRAFDGLHRREGPDAAHEHFAHGHRADAVRVDAAGCGLFA